MWGISWLAANLLASQEGLCTMVCVCVCVCVCCVVSVLAADWFLSPQVNKKYLITCLITPCSTVLLEKLTGSQPIKIFPAFHGTRRFITAFKSARHLSLSWASSIQSVPPHPSSWRSILILSSHLRLGVNVSYHHHHHHLQQQLFSVSINAQQDVTIYILFYL